MGCHEIIKQLLLIIFLSPAYTGTEETLTLTWEGNGMSK